MADTHTFESDLGELPEGDVFVHAGDLLRGGTLEELEGTAKWIRGLPFANKIIVAGNHDWCFIHDRQTACEMLEGAVYLEDEGLEIDGIRFWGSPWQPAFNDWAFNLERGSALAEKWALIPESTDVLITHSPPAGFGDRGPVPGRLGCEDLTRRVSEVRPALHMFGHIHQDGGVWQSDGVAFANVTTWECERMPTVLDLDLETKQVTSVSVPPRDMRRPA